MRAGAPLLAAGAHRGPGHSHHHHDADDNDDNDDSDDDSDDQVTDLSLIIRLLKGPDPDTNVTNICN